MDSLLLLIFLMFCGGLAGWLLFLWSVKSGQYDDIEAPKYRMLDDDEPPAGKAPKGQETTGKDGEKKPPR